MGNALRLGISRIGLAWTKWRMKTKIKSKSISIIILGLQESGKTTIGLRLWKYKRELPDLNYVQTKGFNFYMIPRKNNSVINLYDLGGHSSIQELWEHYYADAHGIIFVVDSSNRSLISEAAELFSKLVHDERIREKPVLLLANKQDLNGASEMELDKAMNLQEVVNSVRCLTRLDESVATDLKQGKGIFEGFKWLVKNIEKNYMELNDRVMRDTLLEKNREKARRAAVAVELQEGSNPVQMNTNPSTTIPPVHPSRSPSQKSTLSQQGHIQNQTSASTEILVERPTSVGRNSFFRHRDNKEENPSTRNYLIKSRPNSSSHGSKKMKTDPFLAKRNISTAPASGKSSSSEPDHDEDYEDFGKRENLTSHPGAIRMETVEVTDNSRSQQRNHSNNEDHCDDQALVQKSSRTSSIHGQPSAGRLSPEGADSDEGIVNPAFDDGEDADSNVEKKSNNTAATTIDNHFYENPPATTDFENFSANEIPMGKLVRSESSDTERAGEILMVTTLVQVHEELIVKDRRGSTTSTHDSVAVSITSFKSEETDGWIVETPIAIIASEIPSVHNTPPLLGEVSSGTVNSEIQSRLLSSSKDKGKKNKFQIRTKNKTAPLPPAGISTIQLQQAEGLGRSQQRNRMGSASIATTTTTTTNSNPHVKQGIGSVISSSNGSAGGGSGRGKSPTKQKSLNDLYGDSNSSRKKSSRALQFPRAESQQENSPTSTFARVERLKKY